MYAKLTQIFCLLFSLIEILFKHFAPSLLGTLASHPSHLSQTRTRSTAPQPSTFNRIASNRRWPTDSHDKELIGNTFSELEEDSKDDQIYAMTTIEVQSSKAPSSPVIENLRLS